MTSIPIPLRFSVLIFLVAAWAQPAQGETKVLDIDTLVAQSKVADPRISPSGDEIVYVLSKAGDHK